MYTFLMEYFTVGSLLLVFHLLGWILIVILAFEVCIFNNFIQDPPENLFWLVKQT